MKDIVENSHWIILPLIALLTIVLIYRAYKYQDNPSGSVFVKFGISAALVLTAVVSTIILPLNLYLHAVTVITLNAGLYFVYWGLYRVLTHRNNVQSFVKQPVFLTTLVITVIAVVFDLIRIAVWISAFPEMDMPSFNYPQWYTDYATRRPDSIALVETRYWISSAIFFFFYNIGPAFLLGSIVWRYIATLRQRSDIVYLVRRIVCMTGFFIGFFISIVMASGVLTWAIGRDDLRVAATYIYQSGKILMVVVVVGGFLIRQEWLSIPISFIDRLSTKRRQQRYDRITYLHQKMMQVVPSALFPIDDRLVDLDQVMTEISDARRIIWSNISSVWIATPQKEAEIIFQLLANKTVITETGMFFPPPIGTWDILRYNDVVAMHLQRLETQKTSVIRTT
ncbi:MAG TPA: hypothetical protein VFS21_30060 [Roseiflexaceae bacterium]|nr:hypothetical protein [Roseiflexaceae bacterium]